MGFANGSVSFRRFAVIGNVPKTPDQETVDKIISNQFQTAEFGHEKCEYGWVGGRHQFDKDFSFETLVFGEALLLGLRIDTNVVPGATRKAWTQMAEEVMARENKSGFISKTQKKQVKEDIAKKVEEEIKTGKFRKTRMIQLLWDLNHEQVYVQAAGSTLEHLMELFERTFGATLLPISSGSFAERYCDAIGRRQDYEDLRPTKFTVGPEGDAQFPEYPWTLKGVQPKDFLGNEFLLWLMWQEKNNGGLITTSETGGYGTVSFLIDRVINLDCAFGQTGKDAIHGDGPARSPEAREGLRIGKVPRRCGLVFEAAGYVFNLSFNPELMAFGGTKLPDVEEAETPRIVFEERIGMLANLVGAMDAAYTVFLQDRLSLTWIDTIVNIASWINPMLQLAVTDPVALDNSNDLAGEPLAEETVGEL